MIKTVEIRTMEGAQALAFEQTRNESTGRYRSSFFYRGLVDESFSLTTSLYRNCGDLAPELEKPMLENFIKYVRIEYPTIDESIWKAMIIGQHHSLPTRLLDWSHSTLAGLHFALSEPDLNKLEKRDCALWRIDAREINELLPEKYKKVLDEKRSFIFSVENLSRITNSIDEYDRDMDGKALVTLEPPSIDQRIVNQYAFFTVVPHDIIKLEDFLDKYTDNTVKYVIDRRLRWDLRDILDQLNMNERMIYPGIDGIAKWLARHYFVRGKH